MNYIITSELLAARIIDAKNSVNKAAISCAELNTNANQGAYWLLKGKLIALEELEKELKKQNQ